MEKRELEQLWKDIEKLEKRKDEINRLFDDKDLPFDEIKKIIREHFEKIKRQQEKLFTDKFPALTKKLPEGKWDRLKDGTLCFRAKNYYKVEGDITFYNNGRYKIFTGPNADFMGDYSAQERIKLSRPKGGFKLSKKKEEEKKRKKEKEKKNESLTYILSRKDFFIQWKKVNPQKNPLRGFFIIQNT